MPVNLEIAPTNEMLKIALKYKPNFVCIVPEKREEITTEGGLNLKKNNYKLKKIINKLNSTNIRTSLFINASIKDIQIAKKLGVNCIEIHTGKIANLVKKNKNYNKEYLKIKKCSIFAESLNLEVHAGHGLTLETVAEIASILEIEELNIGHSIISDSIFFGLEIAIKKMRKRMQQGRNKD